MCAPFGPLPASTAASPAVHSRASIFGAALDNLEPPPRRQQDVGCDQIYVDDTSELLGYEAEDICDDYPNEE